MCGLASSGVQARGGGGGGVHVAATEYNTVLSSQPPADHTPAQRSSTPVQSSEEK